MRLMLLALSLLLPSTLFAACEGRDLTQDLPPEAQAELENTLTNTPFPQGNHWIAQKDKTVLHLIGTLHLNDARMTAIIERLTPTLSQADAFYFEIVQDEMDAWQRNLAEDFSPVMITSGPTLIDLMTPEDWQALSVSLAERGVPGWMAAKMRPWFLGMMLAMPACLAGEENADHGMDSRLADLALEHGIPQHSLESVDDIIGLFNLHPLEKQVQSLSRMVGTFKNSDDQLATLAEAYFDEQHLKAVEVSRLIAREYADLTEAEFREEWSAFEDHLLIARNNNWMPRILGIQDQTAVIAVGAGHLSGTHGLLNQLQQAGYSLTRAPF